MRYAAISGTWVVTHQSNLHFKKTPFGLKKKKTLTGRALSEKLFSLKYHKSWSHDTRPRLPFRLPIPRTNSVQRMFFCNEVKLWNNVSDNDLVRSSHVKKFKRNYFDSVMCKFTPDSV